MGKFRSKLRGFVLRLFCGGTDPNYRIPSMCYVQENPTVHVLYYIMVFFSETRNSSLTVSNGNWRITTISKYKYRGRCSAVWQTPQVAFRFWSKALCSLNGMFVFGTKINCDRFLWNALKWKRLLTYTDWLIYLHNDYNIRGHYWKFQGGKSFIKFRHFSEQRCSQVL